jgi:hypothetical protein
MAGGEDIGELPKKHILPVFQPPAVGHPEPSLIQGIAAQAQRELAGLLDR